MGCFAMTETGHGSNVQALGTVATYDVATQEFVIETREDANKDYIGNAAEHAELAVVFAQLEVGETSEGRARLRRADPRARARCCAGVRIEDDGPKMGLNGVDNGRIWFDGVRVPRTALLNRFADVTPDGRLRERDREPQQAVLHDARHPGAGAGLRRRRRHQRRQGRADDRDQVRPAPAPVRGDQRGRGGAAARLRHAPAPAVPAARPHLRAALRPGGRRRPAARRLLRDR